MISFLSHSNICNHFCKRKQIMFESEDGGSGGERKNRERIAKKHNETLWGR